MQNKPVALVSRQALHRMPYYLQILKAARAAGAKIISAPNIAAQLGLNEVQVRKDLASVSAEGGRPKTGFEVALGLTGMMALWLGFMKMGERAGMIDAFARAVTCTTRRVVRIS